VGTCESIWETLAKVGWIAWWKKKEEVSKRVMRRVSRARQHYESRRLLPSRKSGDGRANNKK